MKKILLSMSLATTLTSNSYAKVKMLLSRHVLTIAIAL